VVDVDETNAYEPTLSTFVWLSIKDFVDDVIADVAGRTDYDAAQLYAAVSRLVAWTWQRAGLPLDRRQVFALTTIERFIDSGLPQYRTAAGRNTIRSRLLRVSELALPPSKDGRTLRPLGGSDPTSPYSMAETITLRSWAARQATKARRSNAAALIALGMGAGLGNLEIAALRARDVDVDDLGLLVHVSGDRPRVVPLLREWETGLAAHVKLLGAGDWLFRQHRTGDDHNVIGNFVAKDPLPFALQTRRMRSSWIVRHLEMGTPPILLMHSAGVSSLEALDRFVRFATFQPGVDERSILRNGPSRPTLTED